MSDEDSEGLMGEGDEFGMDSDQDVGDQHHEMLNLE